MIWQNQYGWTPRGVQTIPKDALEQQGVKSDSADIDCISLLELLCLHQCLATKHNCVLMCSKESSLPGMGTIMWLPHKTHSLWILSSNFLESLAHSYFWWPHLNSQIEDISHDFVDGSITSRNPPKAPAHPG